MIYLLLICCVITLLFVSAIYKEYYTPLDAFDVDLVVSTLTKLKEGGRVEVPVYDFSTHSRAKYTVS